MCLHLSYKFSKNNVVLQEQNYQEIWNNIKKDNIGIENEICNLFSTIINLIKSNDYSINYVRELCKNNTNNYTIIIISTY